MRIRRALVTLASVALGTLLACGTKGEGPDPATAASADDSASASDSASAMASASAEPDDGSACKGQACIRKCDEKGHSLDCLDAGEALRSGTDGVAMDKARAAKYLDKACDQKERDACYHLAEMYLEADGVTQSLPKGVELLTMACEMGKGDACDSLSKRADKGEGMPKDHKKAIALLAQGCIAEDFQSFTCSSLRDAADKHDREAAKVLADWAKACRATKDATACAGVERTKKM